MQLNLVSIILMGREKSFRLNQVWHNEDVSECLGEGVDVSAKLRQAMTGNARIWQDLAGVRR